MKLFFPILLLLSGCATTRGAQVQNLPDRGGKIVFQSQSGKMAGIYVMNADGTNRTRLTDDAQGYSRGARFSPDGKRIVFMRATRAFDQAIFVMNADGSNLVNLTPKRSYNSSPCFSPDGKRIIWMSYRSGRYQVYGMDADGSHVTQITRNLHGQGVFPRSDNPGSMFSNSLDFSPDGRKITFVSGRDGQSHIYVMNVDGSGQTRVSKNPQTNDDYPRFSRDGKRIAYESVREEGSIIEVKGENGQMERREVLNSEIMLVNVDGSKPIDLTQQSAGDNNPGFSPDGKKIVFKSARNYYPAGIYVMNADGSGATRIASGTEPDWAPGFVPFSQPKSKAP